MTLEGQDGADEDKRLEVGGAEGFHVSPAQVISGKQVGLLIQDSPFSTTYKSEPHSLGSS